MNQLHEYRKDIENLTKDEKKLRDIYLKKLNLGIVQGPQTNFASIDKPWLKYFGYEAFIEMDTPNNLYEFVYFKNKYNLNDTAINFLGNKISYKKLFQKTDEVVEKLIDMGLKSSDVVSICTINSPELIYLVFALNKLGITINMIDVQDSKEEIKEKMINSKSKTLFMIDIRYNIVDDFIEDNIADNIIFLSPFESLSKIFKVINKIVTKKIDKPNYFTFDEFLNFKNENNFEYKNNDIAFIFYTDGTTGNKKAVKITNDNFNSLATQFEKHNLYLNVGQKFLSKVNFSTSNDFFLSLYMPLCMGMQTIIIPSIDKNNYEYLLNKYRPNYIIENEWTNYLLESKNINPITINALKGVFTGYKDIYESDEKLFNKKFNNKLIKSYGMSELTSLVVASNDRCNKLESAGIPLIGNNIKIISLDTKEELGYYEIGEILIKSPSIMNGYLNNQKETNNIIKESEDGTWLHTKDLGFLDKDGCLFIKGRLDNLILKKDMKIFSSEIENVIKSINMQEIDNICVFGASDYEYKQMPVVLIQIKEEYLDKKELIINKVKYICGLKLPDYAQPKDYYVDIVPLTRSNKCDFIKAKKLYELKNTEELKRILKK